MTKTTRVNFAKIITDNDFTAARNSIHRRSETLQMDVHKYLVAVAASWSETGDSRPVADRINSLIDNMPKGIRRNAIRTWVEKHLKLTFVTEGENENSFIVGKAKASALDMQALTNERWFDCAPETVYKPLDLAADLQKLLKVANKRSENAKAEDNIPAELLAALNNIAASSVQAYQH